jgi:mono/diheme cytochrome c family protein
VLPSRPVPATVGIGEAAEWESVTTVPTAGLKERTRTQVPTWLTVIFVILPLAGLLYLLQFSAGPECGDSGLLAVDRQSGEVVNCDGSPFEGRGAPGGGPGDFLARGQVLYADAQVACSGCHGDNGQGGVGPTFAGGAILATFPSCADHVKWVQLGSGGWQAQVGAEYGAQGALSKGGMPNYDDSLSDEDLRSVIVFERVRFGGADLDETLIDCGLVVPELPAEGEDAPADGEEPTEGTEASG